LSSHQYETVISLVCDAGQVKKSINMHKVYMSDMYMYITPSKGNWKNIYFIVFIYCTR